MSLPLPDPTLPEPQRLRLIGEAIEQARPAIRADGGDIRLVAVEGARIKVELSGKCTGCALATQTLGGLRRRLMETLGEPVMVVPA